MKEKICAFLTNRYPGICEEQGNTSARPDGRRKLEKRRNAHHDSFGDETFTVNARSEAMHCIRDRYVSGPEFLGNLGGFLVRYSLGISNGIITRIILELT
jgi:hypothetical protein